MLREHAIYLVILLATLAGPVAAMIISPRLRLSKHEWHQMGRVFLYVSVPFVLLDIAQHARGWWAYNADYILGLHIAGLPVEEVAFFFIVPFSSLYLLSMLKRFRLLQPRTTIPLSALQLLVGIAALALLYIEPKERVLFDVLCCLVVLVLMRRMHTVRNLQRAELLWLGGIGLLFLVVNGLLTGLPVVTYDTTFGSLFRLGTIPFADAIYNVSLLLGSVLVYRYLGTKEARASLSS